MNRAVFLFGAAVAVSPRLGAAENADIAQRIKRKRGSDAGGGNGVNGGETGRIECAEAARQAAAKDEGESEAGVAVKMQFQPAVADAGDAHDGQHHRQHCRDGEQVSRRAVQRRGGELRDAGHAIADGQRQTDAVVGADVMRAQQQQAVPVLQARGKGGGDRERQPALDVVRRAHCRDA